MPPVGAADHGNTQAMAGKTVLITGGSAGIGLVTARRLAAMGAHVAIVGRDEARGRAAAATIGRAVPGAAVTFLAADLASQQEVQQLAKRVGEMWPRLDVLINNAGGMFGRRTLSRDGIEMTFALNHLAYVLLSHRLLPLLDAAAPARIINVASQAHVGARIDFGDLEMARGYDGWRAYKRSKLANLYFTYELARRLDPKRITVNALHPGFVRTDIGVAGGLLPRWLWEVAKLGAISVERGAETSVHLAASRAVAGAHGQYFVRCRPARSSPQSYDRTAALRLWQVSLEMTGLGGETAAGA